jgi:tetratricopeptide (TPR) repeat protein
MPWWDGVEAPAALAYLVSGDTKYLDYGKAPVDWILNIRGVAYSSGFAWAGAMGFGGTLSTYLWALREAGGTQADLGRMRQDVDYEKALSQIMSLAMSKFDAASINGPDSGPFCRLAAEAGRVLVNLGRYDEAIQWLEKWQGKPYSMYVDWTLAHARTAKAQAAAK